MASAKNSGPMKIACIGGIAINRKYHVHDEVVAGTSNPGRGFRTFGGVARNVAENLLRLELEVQMVSVVGDDEAGNAALEFMEKLGADNRLVHRDRHTPTAEYIALFSQQGELYVAVAAMEIFDQISPEQIRASWQQLEKNDWLFAECNLPAPALATLIEEASSSNIHLAVDTVSIPKAQRLPNDLSGIDLLFTNVDEAKAILGSTVSDPADLARMLQDRGVAASIITLGQDGHLVATPGGLFHTTALPADAVDVSGAGDALIAGTLASISEGSPLEDATKTGALLAAMTIETDQDVIADLNRETVNSNIRRLDAITTKRLDDR